MSRSVHIPIWVAIVAILVLSVGFSSALSQSLDPVPVLRELACPSNETIWLEGEGPPSQAVLVYLGQRPVGGSTVNAKGRWRIPLTIQEAPGIYQVEVAVRGERRILARYTCYVDVPFELPTATPTNTPVELPVNGTSGPTAPPPAATSTAVGATATSAAAPTSTPAGTDLAETTTVTPQGTGITDSTATPTPTATPTVTPTPTATPSPASQVQVVFVFQGEIDTSVEPVDWGFAIVRNGSTTQVEITGWVLANISRSGLPQFTFPNFTLQPDGEVTVFVDDDGLNTDDELYWGANQRVWLNGDTVVLRNNRGQEVSRCVVGQTSCNS